MKAYYNEIVYYMPCKPGSVYINVTDQCVNNCLFCIKRDGPVFFGHDLSLFEQDPKPSEILASLKAIPGWPAIKEIVFCGMGEPMLRYKCIIDVCRAIRRLKQGAKIRVDTSGLFWAHTQQLDILDYIDILSVSLNAENAEKYEELCKPEIKNAFDILMDFLTATKIEENRRAKQNLPFPDVRLSIVDTSEEKFLPTSGFEGYTGGAFPVPDFDKCKAIANSFGWPLIVKRLFRDSKDRRWQDQAIRDLMMRGISPDCCSQCTHRH